MDTFIRLVEALAKLVASLAWPGVALIALWWFGSAIKQFLTNVSEGSFKAFGIEGSAKRIVEQALISADLSKSKDATNSSRQIAQLGASVGKSLRAADLIERLSRPDDMRVKSILWVDDQPENNVFERQALTALGFIIEDVADTETALARIRANHYDAIISDMSRPSEPEAGKVLLRRLREAGNDTPFILYSGSDDPTLASQMKDAGAFATTYLASQLVVDVVEAVGPGLPQESYARRLREQRNRLAHIRTSS
jgi:CheY-like chemotaxis protein